MMGRPIGSTNKKPIKGKQRSFRPSKEIDEFIDEFQVSLGNVSTTVAIEFMLNLLKSMLDNDK